MELVPKVARGRQMIDAYGDGGFRIAGLRHVGSVLVFAERTLAWAVNDPAGIGVESLAPVFAAEPRIELLLLGCGQTMAAIDPKLRIELRRHGFAVEALDTGAACRTFNVVLAEGRRVAAALIALP
jgi:uncharacterized protein